MTYVATDALKGDPLDQKIVNCGHSLAAMASSGQFVDVDRVNDGIPLIGSAQPGILPCNGNILVVAAISDVGTVVVAELYRLMPGHRDRGGHTHPRVPLQRHGILDSVYACCASEPIVAIG